MTDPLPDLERVSTSDPDRRPRTRLRIAIALTAVVGVIGLAVVAGGGHLWNDAGPTASGSTTGPPAAASASGLPARSASAASDSPGGWGSPPASGSPAATDAPSPTAGLIAVVDDDGALSTVDAFGGSRVTYPAPGVVFGFPAWSPDGSQIAVVGERIEDAAIYVFTVDGATGTQGVGEPPTIVYRSADRRPFYLYWTPDGGHISFLTGEDIGLALRVAPVDGIPTVDGDGPSSVLRRGAPLYFDWVDAGRALIHVGSGSESFVGEVDLSGAVVGSASGVVGTGSFRPAVQSHDGRYLAYATSSTDAGDAIVVAARDQSTSHRIPTFGPSAMLFDPTGDTLAAIAADRASADPASFPLGPLRLIDPASGAVRTLLDGSVVAFFWSPDGRTIATLQVSAPGQIPVAAGDRVVLTSAELPGSDVAPSAQSVGVDVGLAFVDVATSSVRAERVVRLADHFIGQLLPYFDQYALSHRLWSPDSSSLLLPLVARSGADQLVVLPADGSTPRPIADGPKGFWSP